MEAPVRVKVWDGPTRLFHWALVVLIPASWWTAEEGMIDLHRVFGIVLLGLLVFRLLWGLVGSSTARFSGFVRGPRTVMAYLGGRGSQALGHNPLGGWSVIAMLVLLGAQVGLGLVASDEDGLESGPLAHLLGYESSRAAAELHEALFDVVLVFIGLHLAAILYHRLFRRDDLVRPMLVGTRPAPRGTAPMAAAPAWRFAAAALLAAGVAWWIWNGARW